MSMSVYLQDIVYIFLVSDLLLFFLLWGFFLLIFTSSLNGTVTDTHAHTHTYSHTHRSSNHWVTPHMSAKSPVWVRFSLSRILSGSPMWVDTLPTAALMLVPGFCFVLFIIFFHCQINGKPMSGRDRMGAVRETPLLGSSVMSSNFLQLKIEAFLKYIFIYFLYLCKHHKHG